VNSRKLNVEHIETDVLCIGGGPSGLCAAIRAAELGAEVVVADKSNTLRSGDAGMGNDHFACRIPEVHGDEGWGDFVQMYTQTAHGYGRSEAFMEAFLEGSYEMVKLWDSWGIPMKYEGKYVFAGHKQPGAPLFMLHFSGQNMKVKLTRKALKSGVKIINRVMIVDLIHDGGTVIGAIGVDVREPRMLVFKAKAVIAGTGKCQRLFPGATPGWLFNTNLSPVNTGDGRAMAYRAGCELTDMELTHRWSGPKYFARNGKGSWMGVLRDPQGEPIGPYLTRPDPKGGDSIAHVFTIFDDYQKSGKGPVYMDCAGLSDEDYEHMKYWLVHEGNTGILDHLEREGVDPREKPFEFMTYGVYPPAGIRYNEKCETPLKGLFAAGDEFGGLFMSGAAVFGNIAGESASKHAGKAEAAETPKGPVMETRQMLEDILNREGGAGWQEANVAVQQTMSDYCGDVRSEALLTGGLEHLKRLKNKTHNSLVARNQHELMRCIEVLNLIDIGEVVLVAANERKESRFFHNRADFPGIASDIMGKMVAVKRENGQPVAELKDHV